MVLGDCLWRMVLGVWFWVYGFGCMVWLWAYGFWAYVFRRMVFISKNNTLRAVRPVRLTHLTAERKSRIRTQRRIDVAS